MVKMFQMFKMYQKPSLTYVFLEIASKERTKPTVDYFHLKYSLLFTTWSKPGDGMGLMTQLHCQILDRYEQ